MLTANLCPRCGLAALHRNPETCIIELRRLVERLSRRADEKLVRQVAQRVRDLQPIGAGRRPERFKTREEMLAHVRAAVRAAKSAQDGRSLPNDV